MPRITIPAPLGGVNLRDGIANIQSPEAVTLNNLIPRPTCVETRGATVDRGDAQVGPIRTLAGHPAGFLAVGGFNGVQNYLRAFNTTTNAYGAATGISANNAPFWNTTLFQSLLILTNGADTPQAMNAGGGFAPLVITGVTASTLWGCQTFKGRVFYWKENAQAFWYAAAGAYQGALTEFDLSAYTVRDGYLLALVPLTIDGGAGPDDLAAFVFSTGEVLLFQGDDPGDANAWQQIGRFYIPTPIGPQCWQISGSASVVSTEVGLVDLARALAVGPYDASALVGQQISGPRIADTASPIVRSQLQVVPNDNILVWARYPGTSYLDGGAIQVFAMDLASKRWGVVEGWETATAIGVCANRMFVGDSQGYLSEYVTGGSDDSVGQNGSTNPISYRGKGAFTDLGAPANRKQVTGVNLICDSSEGSSSLDATVSVYADYIESDGGASALVSSVFRDEASQRGEHWSRIMANGFRLSVEMSFGGSGLGRGRWYGADLMLRTGGEM